MTQQEACPRCHQSWHPQMTCEAAIHARIIRELDVIRQLSARLQTLVEDREREYNDGPHAQMPAARLQRPVEADNSPQVLAHRADPKRGPATTTDAPVPDGEADADWAAFEAAAAVQPHAATREDGTPLAQERPAGWPKPKPTLDVHAMAARAAEKQGSAPHGVPPANEITQRQAAAIYATGRARLNLSESGVADLCAERYGVQVFELTKKEASDFIEWMNAQPWRGED